MKLKKIIFITISILSVNGCFSAPAKSFRGVPSELWQHLTAEQKQLLVDYSYEEEFNKK